MEQDTAPAEDRPVGEPLTPDRPVEHRPAVARNDRSGTGRALIVVGTVLALTGLSVAVLGGPTAGPSRAETVQPEVALTAMDQVVQPANNSPLLVADPTDERFVVIANRLDAPDFSCALEVSGDGGRGWAPAQPVPVLPPGADKCYAPEAAFDRAGRLFYLFVGLAGDGNEPMGVFLTSSTDRGRTFEPPRQVLGPLNFAVRMAIDPTLGEFGRIHLVWLHATSDPPTGAFGPPPNPIQAAFSDDGGRTFSEPLQVNDDTRARVVAPALSLGPDHAVSVAYYDLGNDARDYQGLEGPVWEEQWELVVAGSDDGGLSFGQGVVAASVTPHERVMLIFTMPPPSVVSSGKRVCVSWTDARNGDPDAYLTCSDDSGQSWADNVRLNDDPVGNGTWQYQPRLAIAPDGRLDAVFFDRRATRGNVATDIFYTSSDDGQRFRPNLRLTSDPSDPRIGQQYGNASAKDKVEIGSRLALLSRRDSVLAAWPDTRNSEPFGKGQDIFATTVELSRSADSSAAFAAGGALLAGGLACLVVGLRASRRRVVPGTTPGGDARVQE